MRNNRDLSFAGLSGIGHSEPPELVRKGLRRFIFWTVLILHVFVFFLPFLWFLFSSWIQPKKMTVTKVVFVDSEPNDNLIPSHFPGKNPTPNENPALGDGNPPPSVPDDPGKVDPIPDPVPLPPVPPKTKIAESKKPVKAVVKKTVKAPEKSETPSSKTVSKHPQKPPKKTYLDPKDIKITRSSKTGKGSKTGPRSNSRYSQAANDLNALANDLRRGTGGSPKGSVTGRGDPGGAGGPLGDYDPTVSDYHARLISFLRNRWRNMPSRNSLGGRYPVAKIHFVIDDSGRILNMRLESSGVPVMDASVLDVMRGLSALPAPPKGMTRSFYVNMRIDERF